ncbi:MAG TPA: hypothetical protein VFX01_06115 [Methylophilaceae bacterium]|nr:hypothetical protein [Methylophilaceae bacterium]
MGNDKKTTTAESRAGARACLDALRMMETIANENSPDYYAERELMASVLIKAAQPSSPFMTGFIAVLAEYIDLNLSCGAKLAQTWTPEATLSEDEREMSRQQSYAAVSA